MAKGSRSLPVRLEAAHLSAAGVLSVTFVIDLTPFGASARAMPDRAQFVAPEATPSETTARLPTKTGRIVAHVPRWLIVEFDEYCDHEGLTRSGALLQRIAVYVTADGKLRRERYGNPAPLPRFDLRQKEKKPVQILAPKPQVLGFKRFCQTTGTKKDAFVMREMRKLLDRATDDRPAWSKKCARQ